MEITPAAPTPKRPRAKKTVAASAKATEAADLVKAKSPTKSSKKAKDAAVTPAPAEDLSEMIATAAYYLAAQRSFTPGHEMEDWLRAEKQIRSMSR